MEQGRTIEPGSAPSIQALCTALLAGGLDAAPPEQIEALEALHPATQAEWEMACRVFAGLKRAVWLHIMTTRFLERVPDNVPARVSQAARLADMPKRRQEAVPLLASLMEDRITNPADLRMLATACHFAGQQKMGVAFLERAVAENPADAEARIVLAHDQISRGEMQQAKKSLDVLMAMRGDTLHGLMAVMTLASGCRTMAGGPRRWRRR